MHRSPDSIFGSINVAPFWSPNGDRIVFSSNRGGITNLYQKAAAGTAQDEVLLATENSKVTTQLSRDGQFIVCTEFNPNTKQDIWLLPMGGATQRKPVPFLRSEFNELLGQLSPDGQWMAYKSDATGQREVYVRPFPPSEGQWPISIAGGEQPRWRSDGQKLFFVEGNRRIMAVAVKAMAGTKPSFEPGIPRPLFEAHLVSAIYRQRVLPIRRYRGWEAFPDQYH